jgi:hypothetical protein
MDTVAVITSSPLSTAWPLAQHATKTNQPQGFLVFSLAREFERFFLATPRY